MANQEQLDILARGVEAWNEWRRAHPDVRVDLSEANLNERDLRGADLHEAYAVDVKMSLAHLDGAQLQGAIFQRAALEFASFVKADASKADFLGATLSAADFSGATLDDAKLGNTLLSCAHLNNASLKRTDLSSSIMLHVDLQGAHLEECRVFGVSAWNILGEAAAQKDLIITRESEALVAVDDLELAQFVYLLLNNKKIRNAIDTVGKKAVLILGRFTPERKEVLDTIRKALRARGYVPLLFDFEGPEKLDLTETVRTLAHMARFIVADLTDASSLPKELEAIVPHLAVPVQPLLEGKDRPYSMFKDYWKYTWVLKVHRYDDPSSLLASLDDKVITPAEDEAASLQERRRQAMTG